MVIEIDCTTEQAAAESASEKIQKLAGIENRWANSLFSPVLRANGECDWRQHVRFATEQILGFLMSLADLDPERFVWCGWEAFKKNAEKIGETPIGRSQTFAILRQLRLHGITAPATRFRRGATRRGLIVLEHDLWTVRFKTLSVCALKSERVSYAEWEAKAIRDNERREARKRARLLAGVDS